MPLRGLDRYANLVKEDILAITALSREVFEVSVLIDAVLLT